MRWIALCCLLAGCGHTTYTRIRVVVVQPVTCSVEIEVLALEKRP